LVNPRKAKLKSKHSKLTSTVENLTVRRQPLCNATEIECLDVGAFRSTSFTAARENHLLARHDSSSKQMRDL